MANENESVKHEGGEHKPEHKTSWLGHIVEEIKEKFDELVEEAQNDGGEFSALGNGHINVVHDHRKHHNTEEQPAETPPVAKAEEPKAEIKEESKAEHHKSWLGHIVEEVKEKFDELVEEAQNDGGEFSALGNGHINVVHDHRKKNNEEENKAENKEQK